MKRLITKLLCTALMMSAAQPMLGKIPAFEKTAQDIIFQDIGNDVVKLHRKSTFASAQSALQSFYGTLWGSRSTGYKICATAAAFCALGALCVWLGGDTNPNSETSKPLTLATFKTGLTNHLNKMATLYEQAMQAKMDHLIANAQGQAVYIDTKPREDFKAAQTDLQKFFKKYKGLRELKLGSLKNSKLVTAKKFTA